MIQPSPAPNASPVPTTMPPIVAHGSSHMIIAPARLYYLPAVSHGLTWYGYVFVIGFILIVLGFLAIAVKIAISK